MELRILMLEDSDTDAELNERALRKDQLKYHALRVQTREDFIAALTDFRPDIILADNKLPTFDGVTALMISQDTSPFVPFIFVTGTMGEEWVVEMMKRGATDYVLKNNLIKLGQSVRRAISEAEERENRIKAEDALYHSELKYRRLMNSIKDVFFALDTDLCYTYWNRASEILTGISSEEAVGKSLYDLFPDILDSKISSIYLNAMQADEKRHVITEYFLHGKKYYFEIDIYPNEHGMSVIAKDITEKKESELRENLAKKILLQLNTEDTAKNCVIEIMKIIKDEIGIDAIGIRMKEGDDYPYYSTTGFADEFVETEASLCEYDEHGQLRREITGNPYLDCMCGAVIRGNTDPSKPFFTEHGSFWTNNTDLLLESAREDTWRGKVRNRCNSAGYKSVALIPLLSHGTIIGLLQMNAHRENFFTEKMVVFFEGIGTSIGIAIERMKINNELSRYSKELESMVDDRARELRDAQEQLIRHEKLAVLGELAGGVSHELRNPIGAIKNAVYYMKMEKDSLPDDVKTSIDIIEDEVRSANRIVSSLLDFARPRPPEYISVDVNRFISNMLTKINIPESITVSLHLEDNLPELQADDVQLMGVLENILNNSIQAMPLGGNLSVTTGSIGGEHVSITVSDTGCGIPEKEISRLFEPLYTTKAKGIGLGLSITKVLVERHGGNIDIKSTVNVGTSVTVTFPFSEKEIV